MKGIERIMELKDFDFKTMTLDQMAEYIEEKAPQDKGWFKSIAYIDKGEKKVYSHLRAKREFCKKYIPEILPVAKEPKKQTRAKEILENC